MGLANITAINRRASMLEGDDRGLRLRVRVPVLLL